MTCRPSGTVPAVGSTGQAYRLRLIFITMETFQIGSFVFYSSHNQMISPALSRKNSFICHSPVHIQDTHSLVEGCLINQKIVTSGFLHYFRKAPKIMSVDMTL